MIRGNGKPHFSLTMASWVNGRHDGDGADHKPLVAIWPELQPLADLHLSDIDGVPMHAEANGWYWLAGAVEGGFQQQYHGGSGDWAKTPAECLEIFAKYVRVSLDEAAKIRDFYVVIAARHGAKSARADFAKWIVAQGPRWKAEADKCIADLGLVVYGDPYTPEAA